MSNIQDDTDLDDMIKRLSITAIAVEYGSDGQKRYVFDIAPLKAALAALVARREAQSRIEGMKQAKSRVLRRTEIPADAKNPTRDAVVILGEQIADIIQGDIDALTTEATQGKGDAS